MTEAELSPVATLLVAPITLYPASAAGVSRTMLQVPAADPPQLRTVR